MQLNTLTHYSFSHPGIESYLQGLENHLQTYAQIEGRLDGQQAAPPSAIAVRVKIYDYVYSKVKEAVHFIEDKLQIAANVVSTREGEQVVQQQSAAMNRDASEVQKQIDEKEQEKRRYTLNPFKTKYGNWLMPLAIIAALLDCSVSFLNYRVEYPWFTSVTLALSLALIIGLSHKVSAPFILKHLDKGTRLVRGGLVAIGAILIFYTVTSMRIHSISSVVNTSLDGTQQPITHAWFPIFILSIGLFFMVQAFALAVWKSKEEEAQEEAYTICCKKICELKAKKEELENWAKSLTTNILQQKRDGRHAFEYGQKAIARAKQTGDSAIKTYKQTFAKYNSAVPEHFLDEPTPAYEDELHFTTQKQK